MSPATTSDPALEADALVKSFGSVAALDHVSLAVARAECLALVGESGSGKTTLLRCFNRMVQPDRGTVRVDGQDVATLDPVQLRRRTGYVPQDGGLLPHWTVLRNVSLVPWLERLPDVESRARTALTNVGLDPDDFGGRRPAQLSGGQRQRVAIARALAAGPPAVLLDEPFGALDAITRADLQAAFAEIRKRLRFTTLLVTHDLAEAATIADRVAVLRQGSVHQVGTFAQLRGEPATDYVRDLLAKARFEVTPR